ncbi:MAG TPA: hypothetical protein VEJ84_01640, partial [Acidimicrobiales bacterium]|nr:hypothetical protein [Acidimicrobiales bacterium]
PTLAHFASLVGAFAFWAYLDRGLWFFGDEWAFLVGRGLSYAPADPSSIWFPHNEHWSTLPILLWRALFNVFHLSSYWPYILPVLFAQVAIMHLTWRLCLRSGATPWVATAAVAVLGFLGAGAEDLAWAFQIGFVGSVLFGLIALELLERLSSPGLSSSGKKWCGALTSLALLASLMCSTIGDAMVVGAAVLAFARLPWRRAVQIIAPPVVGYLIWFLGVGRLGIADHSDRFPLATFTGLPNFVWTGLSWALGQTFNLPAAGAALLVGLAAWLVWNTARFWREQPALLGLSAAAVTFFLLAGLGRDTSTGTPEVSRYVYVAIALLVPVMAKLLSPQKAAVPARLAAVALLAVTALGNIGQANTWVNTRVALTSKLKTEVLATGRLLVAGDQDVTGENGAPVQYFPNLSAAALTGLERAHQLPTAPLSPLDLVNARTLLAVGDWNGSTMSLSPKPLVPGHFAFLKAENAVTNRQHDGCLVFTPQTVAAAIQVWLRVPSGDGAASALVEAAPASPGVARYVAAVLAPPQGPSSSLPVELVVPPSGKGYVSDNDAQADLVLLWDAGTALTLCEISPSA